MVFSNPFSLYLQVDGESWVIKPIFLPQLQHRRSTTLDISLSKGASLLSKDMSILEEDSTLTDTQVAISSGALNCMSLHKNGLYVGGKVSVVFPYI